MKQKDRVRQAVDSTLSGLQGDPYLYQRIAARMEEGAKPMKRRKFSVALAMALIVVMSLVTVGFASGVLRSVNWLGETIVDEETMPMIDPTPTPEGAEEMLKDFEVTSELINEAEDMEAVLVKKPNGSATWNSVEHAVQSIEEFEALMADAEYLPVFNFIPEGYKFDNGNVFYNCGKADDYIMTSSETLPEGQIVERYRIADGAEFISGYSLTFRESDEDYHYISVYVRLNQPVDVKEYSHGLNEDQTAMAVEVKGMDNALFITSGIQKSLEMRRELEEEIHFYDFGPRDWGSEEVYSEVHVDVRGPMLDLETLAAMFAEE